MTVEIKKSASKSLSKINKRDRDKIQQLLIDLRRFSLTSEIPNDGKLKGYADRYKMRYGAYRIIYKEESQTLITITAIAHRRDIYRRLFNISFSF